MNIFVQQTTLKRVRKEKKISLRKLSALSGIGVSYLHELENRQNYVKPDDLERIASLLEIDKDVLGRDLLWPKRELRSGYLHADKKETISGRTPPVFFE
ncbi:MAG TPA: helix-turn-helix transcriptional regulator [Patescibacteria group bacterium]|nr:helix-turn-helix transcriptional regulator [Patescibacteria group bacterium]